MRMLRVGARAVAAASVAVLLLTVPAMGAATGVITTKADEFNPAASDTYIAWNVYAHKHEVVYAKQFGGSRFRVNPTGTDGWAGSIEGTTLIYQQSNYPKGKSDVYSYDLVSKTRTKIGTPVSTAHWEYSPAGSGDWLMYARYFRNADRKIYLYNTNTHELRRVASTSGRRWIIHSAQVSGNYAIWDKIEVHRGRVVGCDVFLYDIAAHANTKLGNPNARCQYSPAVNPAGTAFFAHGRFGCGKNVVLREQALSSSATTFLTIPDGHDIAGLYAVDNGDTTTDVYYGTYKCGGQADIFKVTQP